MQNDGNFVIYKHRNTDDQEVKWASDTNGKGEGPWHLRMQADGNLVVYDSGDEATWASDTNGKGEAPYKLKMQDDGNLVIYDSQKEVIWASNTNE